MVQAIVRNKATALADMIRRPEDLRYLFFGLQQAITNSITQDIARGVALIISEAEYKRRFDICEKWIRIMRGDCGFTLDKTVDFLPMALRKELDGEPFEPPVAKETGWSPSVLLKDPHNKGA